MESLSQQRWCERVSQLCRWWWGLQGTVGVRRGQRADVTGEERTADHSEWPGQRKGMGLRLSSRSEEPEDGGSQVPPSSSE